MNNQKLNARCVEKIEKRNKNTMLGPELDYRKLMMNLRHLKAHL